jgi:hypothetical protein
VKPAAPASSRTWPGGRGRRPGGGASPGIKLRRAGVAASLPGPVRLRPAAHGAALPGGAQAGEEPGVAPHEALLEAIPFNELQPRWRAGARRGRRAESPAERALRQLATVDAAIACSARTQLSAAGAPSARQ